MKLHQILIIALVLISVVHTGCSDDDGLTPVQKYPTSNLVAKISSENRIEEYDYDERGRVVGWNVTSPRYKGYYKCQYEYPDDKTILCDFTTLSSLPEDHLRHYDVTLTLDDEGKITEADGIFTYTIGGKLTARKKHRHEFRYDTSDQLVKVIWTEWLGDGHGGWQLDRPWQWENTLTWENGNLIRYVDYNGNSRAYTTFEFSYSGLPMAEHKPIAFPYIFPAYPPLQLTGHFGKQSRCEVSGETVTYFDGERRHTEYTYEFTKTGSGTIISRFWTRKNGAKEIEYKVTWTASRQS